MNRRLPIILAALATLSACKDNPENDRRTASGQVLEGTISDAMLPLDTVKSQPPLMKSEVKKAAPTGEAAASVEGEAPGDSAAQAAPAEPPAAEAAD